MFQATRRRLALWYTAVTAVLLLLFASGFYGYVRATLVDRIDDTLNHVAEVVMRSLVIEPVNPHREGSALQVNVEASFRRNTEALDDDHIDLEWFDADGVLRWSTFTEPLDIPLHVNRAGETIAVPRHVPMLATPHPPAFSFPPPAVATDRGPDPPLLLRQVTVPVEIGHTRLGYLRVSHPWFEVTKPTRRLMLDLSLGTAAMVGAVAAIGWLLSGLAMEPIRASYQRLKQFTADASHELRTPIALIQTNVQAALADPDPDPQVQRQQFQVVERLTRRLGRLVDDLLFLARQDSGIVQPRRDAVDLEHVLAEVIAEQQAIAQTKELTLIWVPNVTSDPAHPGESTAVRDCIEGDRDQLVRLFTNVISNSVQYTPAGGQVTVTLTPEANHPLGRHLQTALKVTIQDTGIGIPPDALPQVFDRFYRADPARSHSNAAGSGLGLAIAQAIVANHHGQIEITSVPQQGTTVTIWFPFVRSGA
ncbi:ATP-binding protein [Trichothermofontia sichuanensis B231]|uniref:sensor histidine kinase n=1 Tax=Trichothermofontia sichuanensis TaxID=3045816 RepID=UPI0022478707|nr:ATP-binding protein [Trichothermofontia sichuanensis]UZQ54345.1 ATP-binding protein [Trichothermofontia sichuanensis B231]